MSFRSNGNIINADGPDILNILNWNANYDSGTGASSSVTFQSKSCIQMETGASTPSTAGRGISNDIPAASMFPNRTVFSINLYHSSLGTRASADTFFLDVTNGNQIGTGAHFQFCTDGLFILRSDAQYYEVGTDLVATGVWQEWTFDFNFSARTADIYLNDVLQASGFSCGLNDNTNAGCNLIQYSWVIGARRTYVDWFKAGSDFAVELPINLYKRDVGTEKSINLYRRDVLGSEKPSNFYVRTI